MIPLPDSFADDSAQAEVADNRIYDQRDHADEPDDTGKIGPYIQGIDAAYRRSGKCLSQILVLRSLLKILAEVDAMYFLRVGIF